MMSRLRAFPCDIHGAVALEFTILAPVVLIIFFAVTDLGLGFYTRMQTQTAAQRGAIYATVRGFNQAAISNTITSSRGAISATPAPREFCGCPDASTGVTEVACGSTCTFGGATTTTGTYVRASAATTYTPIFRYPGLPSPINFSAEQVVRIK